MRCLDKDPERRLGAMDETVRMLQQDWQCELRSHIWCRLLLPWNDESRPALNQWRELMTPAPRL